MTQHDAHPGDDRVLVLITGSGRSGTSSLAGSLSKLGMHVPEPVVQPTAINPKGFFETSWVVDFHQDLLRRAMVRSSDGSVLAERRVHQIIDADARARLLAWLDDQPEPSLLVKDNQACWFVDTWAEAAAATGRELRLLTALRHPAEVVGSRDLVWGQGREDEERRRRETTNVASWLNVALVTELRGRPLRRSFVGYGELIAGWRPALGRVTEQLGLGLEVPPESTPHELDSWLDADLRRSQLTWADLRVPERLQQLAEEAWVQLNALALDPRSTAAQARLDVLGEEYAALQDEAAAIARDESRHQQKAAARRSGDKVRARFRRRLGEQA
jgi:hypothetical protein